MHLICYSFTLLLCISLFSAASATQAHNIGSPFSQGDHATDADLFLPLRRRRLGATQLFEAHARRATTEKTCPTNYDQCGQGLPSNFCCSSGTSCLSLAAATTVICCPEGNDCSQIEPITCTIGFQNATAYPTLAVHTTNLTGQLPTCGTGCCPFGFTCKSGGDVCVRTKDETLITETTSALAKATVSPSTGTITTVATASASTTRSMTLPTDQADDGDKSSSRSSASKSSRTIGIAAGSSVAGLASIVAVIAFVWIRRKRSAREPARHRAVCVSGSQYSPTPPPLPEKDSHQIPKRKRKSILSWVPSIVNRTPAELPATPVSFSAWDPRWGQGQVSIPHGVHRPYPRDSLHIEEVHELEARWLPQEEAFHGRFAAELQTQDHRAQQRYI